MTIKNLAYRVQQRLSAATDGSFKRSHVYELLAAAFGHSSYAALCSESVFTQVRPSMELPALDVIKLQQRSHDLGYTLIHRCHFDGAIRRAAIRSTRSRSHPRHRGGATDVFGRLVDLERR